MEKIKFLIIIFFFHFCILGYTADLVNPNQILPFADHLFGTQDYYRAITEYKRFIYYFPDELAYPWSVYRIGVCYLIGEQYDEAEKYFVRALNSSDDGHLRYIVTIKRAEIYVRRGMYEKAEKILQEYKVIDDRIIYVRGWIALYQRQVEKAKNIFNQIKPEEFLADIKIIKSRLDTAKNVREYNPNRAMFFSSIVPGAGQLYVRRKRDALSSFLLNGTFLTGAIFAARDDNVPAAAALGIFELGWYFGGIYGARNSAFKKNRRNWDLWINKVEMKTSAPFDVSEFEDKYLKSIKNSK